MNILLKKCLAAAVMFGSLLSISALTPASAARSDDLKGKNVVLVHGAFADASSWNKVIPLLQAKGLHVVAVQNPLSSLDGDVAATRRAIEQQDGPVILVGNSWAGAVITQAGNDDKVKALVYVAAFAPRKDQSINDILKGKPAPSWASALQKDSAGYLTLSTDAIIHDFAQDLPVAQARLVAATQGPWFAGCADDKVTQAAWQSKPSWFVMTERDRIMPPELQAAMAQQIGATVVKVDAGHMPMLSKPTEVAAAIIDAARAAR
ncbi:pimeloyl-ACP methyl ester carboxylesterase [Paraburkholderia sp. GAS448]|uniref:alpha/beta fold hydrolase n=1 Tax=Paraburkholderia sp. GAS448 TaxID=3035136 RepID=UPI003D217E17